MLKTKIFIISLIFSTFCLNTIAMQNKNKINEKSNEINIKNEDKIYDMIKNIEYLEKINFSNINIDEIKELRNELIKNKKIIEKWFSFNNFEKTVQELLNKVFNLILRAFESLILKMKDKNIEYEKIDEIEEYINFIGLCQKDLTEIEQKTTDEKDKNKIDMLIYEFFNINLDLIKKYALKQEKNIKRHINSSLLFILNNHAEYLKTFDRFKNEKNIYDQSNITEEILNIQSKIFEKYYGNEKIIERIEYLEKINFNNMNINNIEITITEIKDYIIQLERSLNYNNLKPKTSNLLNKFFNLMLKAFESLMLKIKDKNIEYEEIGEIEEDIDAIKDYQKDLTKIKQKTTDEKDKNKIDILMYEFFNINLNLIKKYANKSKTELFENDIKSSKSPRLLSCLHEYIDYLEKMKKEIKNENINLFDETKKEILNAEHQILKMHYLDYIEYYISNEKTTDIGENWNEFNLVLLTKIKNDCVDILKSCDISTIDNFIKKLSNQNKQ